MEDKFKDYEAQPELPETDAELFADDGTGHNALLDLPEITDEDFIASGYVKVDGEWIAPPRQPGDFDVTQETKKG